MPADQVPDVSAMLVDMMIFLVQPGGFGAKATICASDGKAAYKTHIITPLTIIPACVEMLVPIPLRLWTISVPPVESRVSVNVLSCSKCLLIKAAKSVISSCPGRKMRISPSSASWCICTAVASAVSM